MSTFSFSKALHPPPRWLAWALGILAVLALLLYLAAYVWLSPWVKRKLEAAVSQHSNYKLSINSLHINVLRGSCTAQGIVLLPDSTRPGYTSLPVQPLVLRLHVASIYVNGVQWWNYLMNKNIHLGTLYIEQPDISINTQAGNQEKKGEVKESLVQLVPQLVGNLTPSLKIAVLEVVNASLHYQGVGPKGTIHQSVDSVHLSLKKLAVPGEKDDRNAVFFSKLVQLSFKHFNYTSPDSLYRWQVASVNCSSQDSSLLVTGAQLVPLLSDNAFMQRKGYQADRLHIVVGNGQLRHLNFHRMIYTEGLQAGQLSLDNLWLDVYLDKGSPKDLGDQPKMLNETIQALPFYLRLDTVKVHHSTLRYREKSATGKEPGLVYFSNFTLKGHNITNDSSRMKPTTPALISAQALLMGHGLLTLHMSIPLLSKPFNCSYQGSLTGMPLQDFNLMLDPNDHLRLEDGQMEHIDYKVNVVNGKATGEMQAKYHDLKMSVLRPSDGGVKKILSAIGNLVLRKNNTDQKKVALHTRDVRTVKLEYERVPQDSFMRFLWRSLKNGLLHTILPEEIAKRVKNPRP